MLRESSLEELVYAWQSIEPEEKMRALVGQRKILEESFPGLYEQLRERVDAADKEEIAAQKVQLEAERLQRHFDREREKIPLRIAQIQRKLRGNARRDERAQKRHERTLEKLATVIIKQIRTESFQPLVVPPQRGSMTLDAGAGGVGGGDCGGCAPSTQIGGNS